LSGAEASASSGTRTILTPPPPPGAGGVLGGKYRILEELGRGGMGVVYKAQDTVLGRPVALKFIPPHLASEPDLVGRFINEARAAAALSHPNICVIHEIGDADGQPFIAMEYVEGETLRDKLRGGPLAPAEALAIASQAAAGLAEAHRRGIIHRDVKSANIMLTPKGQAKIMDFGLAKLQGGSSLTRTRTTLGTVAYMSPEQARGDELDSRTDIWSLGVVFYEMLTGALPFKGDHDQTVIHAILHKDPVPLKAARPGLAPELQQIVNRALCKVLSGRYATMEEFAGDIDAVREGLKPPKSRAGRGRRKILGIRAAYAYAALIALLAAAFGLDIGRVRSRLFGRPDGAAPGPAIRLAVLPFSNLSGDPQQDYFSDGMTLEMIARLGRLHPESLGVIAHTSVARYQNTKLPMDQIGRELGVDYVLEGSALREGNRVRITAELIRVRGQSQLWADSYEREMSGVLSLQNEVSQKVADALALKLLPAERSRLARARAVDPAAYDAYLKGAHYYIFMTKSDLDNAERYFKMALDKDPSFAPAYSGLSLVWACRQQLGYAPPSEAGPAGKDAARKAVALDDASAEAHYALADILTWTDWDWTAAEMEWKRTFELNPNFTEALANYAHFQMIRGLNDEGLALIDKAVKLDPYNFLVLNFRIVVLFFVRRFDEAIAQGETALKMQPGSPLASASLFPIYVLKGKDAEAIAAAKAYYRNYDPGVEAVLDRGYAEGGLRTALKRMAEYLAGLTKTTFVLPLDIAIPFCLAGEKGPALDWLERGYEGRDPNMPYLRLPEFDAVRSEPRFQALFRKMNLEAPATSKK